MNNANCIAFAGFVTTRHSRVEIGAVSSSSSPSSLASSRCVSITLGACDSGTMLCSNHRLITAPAPKSTPNEANGKICLVFSLPSAMAKPTDGANTPPHAIAPHNLCRP